MKTYYFQSYYLHLCNFLFYFLVVITRVCIAVAISIIVFIILLFLDIVRYYPGHLDFSATSAMPL